jgi:hypothetical protein
VARTGPAVAAQGIVRVQHNAKQGGQVV